MVVVIGTRLLCGGCLLGIFMGLLVGCVLGGPTALFTYLSIQDAVRHGATKSFSLDNCTSAHDSCIDVRLRSSRQRSPMTGPQRRITSGASFTHASPSVPPWDSVRAMRNHACCTYAIQKLANAGWRAALHLALTPLLSPLLCRVWIRCDDSRQALRACAHAACVHHETGGRYSVALLGNAMILTDTRAGLQ